MDFYDLFIKFFKNNFTYFTPPLNIPTEQYEIDLSIYLIIITIGLGLIGYIIKKLHKEHKLKSILAITLIGNLLGITLIVVNLFLTFLVLLYSHGRYTVLFQYKGWVAVIGYAIFSISLPYLISIIVNPKKRIKTSLNYIFFILIFIFVILTISVFLNFLDISLIPLSLVGIIGFFVIVINLGSISVLYLHAKNLVKKFQKRRIYLLVLAISVFTLDFMFSFLDLLLYIPNYNTFFMPFANILTNGNIDGLKTLFEYTILPITRIFTLLVSILLFYCSYFFPNFVQDLLGFLPPSMKLSNHS